MWKATTLGEVAEIITGPFGSALHKSDYKPSGTAVLMPQNIGNRTVDYQDIARIGEEDTERLSRYRVTQDDIIYARRGDVEKHAFVTVNDTDMICGTGCMRIRVSSPEVMPKFASFYLNRPETRQWVVQHAVGSNMPNLNSGIVSAIPLSYPPKDEQEAIVDLLDSLDVAIAANVQVNDNLQAMLQTLYGYWFLQFDFPDENGRPYRSSGGRMVWNDQLKREIPEGWGVASLISNPLCEPLKPGVAPFSEKTYLATADVVGTTIKNGSRIRYETREGRANMEPVLNSVWFAKMKGSIKHLFLNEACASLIGETILSTGFVGLKCEPVAFEYIASFIASEQFEPLKDLHAHGATQQAVNNADLENILLLVPDAETLRGFSQLASSVLSRFNASTVENKRLQELRDWLLPLLMNGQATVASSDKLSFT